MTWRHETVTVTGERGTTAAIEAFRETIPEEYRHLLVGPVAGNKLFSYVLFPDGGKESHGLSGDMDDVRTAFIALLQTLDVDWAHTVLYDEGDGFEASVSRRPYIAASSRRADEGWPERMYPNLYKLIDSSVHGGRRW